MVNPTQVPVSGPLAEFGPGFASELLRQGYKTNPAGVQMNLMVHLSHWLADEGLDMHRLSDTEVERYLRTRRGAGLVIHCGSRAMRPILAYLRGLGVTPTPSTTLPEGPVDVVLERYRHYLTVDRGLATGTARGYIYAVRPFLCGRILPDGHTLNLEHLRTADITAFIVACCTNGSRGTAKQTVTALRSLLRFLHVEGMVKRSLVAAVPAIARWHLTGLPKSLEPAQVRSLLAACDRRTRSGRRANAEVRSVFVRLNAPHHALSTSGVAHVVTSTARRAGLGHIHAHRLRHTAATQLLRAGASLPEVGQLLRHRLVMTTAIYAKVDREALRTIARPWPGGVE